MVIDRLRAWIQSLRTPCTKGGQRHAWERIDRDDDLTIFKCRDCHGVMPTAVAIALYGYPPYGYPPLPESLPPPPTPPPPPPWRRA